MDSYIHIDENVTIRTGDEARAALARQSDREYLSEDAGVTRVPLERWQTAQACERRHWMELGIQADDDRNWEHESGFEGYRALHGRSFDHAIELGCGPFTNMSIVAGHATVRECSLLDPLAADYLQHPQCAYTHDSLAIARYRRPSLARRTAAAVGGAVAAPRREPTGSHVAVRHILAMPIEQMPTDAAYDLVIIVNVIEHCYDIDLVFDNILSVSPEGSVIVFHDKLYEHTTVKDQLDHSYDAAHPLRVDRERVLGFLDANYTPMLRRIAAPDEFGREALYFVGRRRAAEPLS